MSLLLITALVALGSFLAGFLGALSGLGGGVVLVPLLTMGFGVDIRYAAGASLVSVIATSSGAAAAFVREGLTNIRIGMFLEVATTAGALAGAYVAARVATSALSIVFGVVLLGSAIVSVVSRRDADESGPCPPESLGARLRLGGELPTPLGSRRYCARRLPLGFALMFVAGGLSGLLGIGSGAVKVLAMDWAMRLPFKVSTTTSNFMIGVTAAASAGVYLGRGDIDPGLSAPVMLGVLVGSVVGARVLAGARTRSLRLVFTVVIVALGLEMILGRPHRSTPVKRDLASGASDERVEILVSRILRIGLLVSGVVVLTGSALSLWEHRGAVVDYHLFRGEPTDLRGPRGIWHAARTLKASGIIQLGLLILIGTPIARVAFVAIAFARQRDRLYAAVALAVFAMLLFGAFGMRL